MVVITINPDTDFNEVLANCKDYDELQQTLEPLHIEVTQTDDARVQFRVNQFDTSIKRHKISYQCKGVILDELEHTFLSIPGNSHSYYDHINKKLLKELYDNKKYKLIKANDGTNVTLYHFNGSTCMATAKSHDVSNYFWEGDDTFAQMFYESAKTYPQFIEATQLRLTEAGTVSWNIPENYCVTFGFRHHSIHKNTNDSNDIWLIRCVDRTTGFDVPFPESLLHVPDNKLVEELPTFDDLVSRCTRDQFIDQEENFYGYIFISMDPTIQFDLQRVFIPSTLYRTLQHFFYSFNKNKTDQLTHKNRYLYSIFRNILLNNKDYLKLLCKLDKSYSNKIQRYNLFIDMISTKTWTRLQDESYAEDDVAKDFMDDIINQIKQEENDLVSEDDTTSKLINDYVRNFNNAKALVDLYIKKME